MKEERVVGLVLGCTSFFGSLAMLLHYRSQERRMRNRLYVVVTLLVLCEAVVQAKFMFSNLQQGLDATISTEEMCRVMATLDQFFAVASQCWFLWVLVYLFFAVRSYTIPAPWIQHTLTWGYAVISAMLPLLFRSFGRTQGLHGTECWVLDEWGWLYYGLLWLSFVFLIYLGQQLYKSKMFVTSLNERHIWRLVLFLVAYILMALVSSVLVFTYSGSVKLDWAAFIVYCSKGTVSSVTWFLGPALLHLCSPSEPDERLIFGPDSPQLCCWCFKRSRRLEAIDCDAYSERGQGGYGTIGLHPSGMQVSIKQQFSEDPSFDHRQSPLFQEASIIDDSVMGGDARVSFE